MNAFKKTKTGIGKKILSVMSAAMVGLSALGGLRLTDTAASAAEVKSGVYYDAGTFVVDANRKLSSIDSSSNGELTLENNVGISSSVGLPFYSSDGDVVAFKSGITYVYVAQGTVASNGAVTWNVKAYPDNNVNSPSAPTSMSAAQSAFTGFDTNTAIKWTSHNMQGSNSNDPSVANPWLTLETAPFSNGQSNGSITINGYSNITKYKNPWNGAAATEDDIYFFEMKNGSVKAIGFYTGEASNDTIDGVATESSGTWRLSAGHRFEDLIHTNADKTLTETPTFAVPLMIRECWLDALPVIVDDCETEAGAAISGFRLDKMVGQTKCDDIDETLLSSPYTVAHIEELRNTTGTFTGYDTGVLEFGVNNYQGEAVTKIDITSGKDGASVIYTELPSNMVSTYSDELCKIVSLKDCGLRSTTSDEVCNTRAAMTTNVNARYSYSTDRPRLAGTINGTPVTVPTDPVGSPRITSTVATNAPSSTGKTITPSTNATINDRVYISGLAANTNYVLRASVADPDTGSVYNDIRVVDKSFTATSDTAIIDVTISLDSTKYEGKKLVVYETLYDSSKSNVLSTHANRSDRDQTVTVEDKGDPAAPSNKSIATDKVNDTHTMTYSPNATIKNKVPYTGLTSGKKYTVTSTTYDLSTGKQVLSPVSKTFTADSTGYTIVEIPVNSVIYSGKTFSVLASISDGDKIVSSYDNMSDKDTQVMFPTVATVLTGSNRTSKTVAATGNTEVADLVRYTGLTPGHKYTITGYILHKEQSTGSLDAPIIIGSEGSSVANDIKIVASKVIEFTPETSDGSVVVTFNVNAADLAGQHLVAVETIADGPTNVIVGEHKDINDANQTVAVKSSNNVYTGGNDMTLTFALIAGICGIAVAGICTFMFIRKRRANK